MEDAANNRTFLQQILQQTEPPPDPHSRHASAGPDRAWSRKHSKSFRSPWRGSSASARRSMRRSPTRRGVTLSAQEVEGDLQVLADADGLRTILNNPCPQCGSTARIGGASRLRPGPWGIWRRSSSRTRGSGSPVSTRPGSSSGSTGSTSADARGGGPVWGSRL